MSAVLRMCAVTLAMGPTCFSRDFKLSPVLTSNSKHPAKPHDKSRERKLIYENFWWPREGMEEVCLAIALKTLSRAAMMSGKPWVSLFCVKLSWKPFGIYDLNSAQSA